MHCIIWNVLLTLFITALFVATFYLPMCKTITGYTFVMQLENGAACCDSSLLTWPPFAIGSNPTHTCSWISLLTATSFLPASKFFDISHLKTSIWVDGVLDICMLWHPTVHCTERMKNARSHDGTCNDLDQPASGSRFYRFGRNVNRTKTFEDKDLLKPSPREISRR